MSKRSDRELLPHESVCHCIPWPRDWSLLGPRQIDAERLRRVRVGGFRKKTRDCMVCAGTGVMVHERRREKNSGLRKRLDAVKRNRCSAIEAARLVFADADKLLREFQDMGRRVKGLGLDIERRFRELDDWWLR